MTPDIGHLDAWQKIIDGVDKSNVPMEFIARIDIFFSDRAKPSQIDIKALREKGYSTEDIEEIITQVLQENQALHSDIGRGSIEFTLDVIAVATAALKETEKLLSKIPT